MKKFPNYSPASEVSKEVANLTERKNAHTPVYGVKEFVSGLAEQLTFNLTRTKNHLKKGLLLWLPELFL